MLAKEPRTTVCRSADWFEVTPEGLRVHWESDASGKVQRVELTEYPDRVEIGVVERVDTITFSEHSKAAKAPVELAAPLGDRAVIDASNGERLVQRGPAPGEPACTPQRLSPAEETNRERAKVGLPPGGDPSPAEKRWLERRETLSSRFERDTYSYLQRQAETIGGVRIEGTFPGPIRFVIGFTRDAERQAAEIAKRTKVPFRVELVAHPEHELRDLAERIEADAEPGSGFLDGYGRAGFYFAGAEVEDDQTITVRLITTRPDHAAYFAARYGPLVRTLVVGDRFECAGTQE